MPVVMVKVVEEAEVELAAVHTLGPSHIKHTAMDDMKQLTHIIRIQGVGEEGLARMVTLTLINCFAGTMAPMEPFELSSSPTTERV
jgi:hypothetical protein